AAVVHEGIAVPIGHAEVVGQLVGPDVVAAADLGRVHAEPAGETVDGPVHGEDGLGAAGAAIGRVRGLVGDDGTHVDAHVADEVRDRVVRQHDAPDVVGAEVQANVVADGEDRPIATGGESDAMRLVTRVGGGHHVLAAILDPLHGATEHDRGDGHQGVLGIPR